MESFDAAKEPLRAIRDLVRECEGIFDEDNEQHVLERARVALAALRALFGDDRPNVIDCLAEALHRHQCGLIRPLWADMSEKMQAPWREYAEKLLPIRVTLKVEDGK